MTAAEWEQFVLSDRNLPAPDPGVDRAQGFYDSAYGQDSVGGHCLSLAAS